MDVSENSGTPKSSILIGFSIINYPFWGTPIFGNTQMEPFEPKHDFQTLIVRFEFGRVYPPDGLEKSRHSC